MKKTFRGRLIISSISILVIFAALSAFTSYYISKRIIIDSHMESKTNQILLLAEQFEDYYEEAQEKVSLMANSLEMEKKTNGIDSKMSITKTTVSIEELNNHLEHLLYTWNEFSSLYVLTEKYIVGLSRFGYEIVKRLDVENMDTFNLEDMNDELIKDMMLGNSPYVLSRISDSSILIGVLMNDSIFGNMSNDILVVDKEGSIIAKKSDDYYLESSLEDNREMLKFDGINRMCNNSYIGYCIENQNGDNDVVLILKTEIDYVNEQLKHVSKIVFLASLAIIIPFVILIIFQSNNHVKPIRKMDSLINTTESFEVEESLYEYIREHNGHMNVRKRIIIFYMINFIPIIFIVMVNYFSFNSLMITSDKKDIVTITNQIGENIEMKLEKYNMLSKFFSMDPQIQEYVANIFLKEEKSTKLDQSYLQENIGILRDDLRFINIYDYNYNLLYTNRNELSKNQMSPRIQNKMEVRTKYFSWNSSNKEVSVFRKINYFSINNSTVSNFTTIGYIEIGAKTFLNEVLDVMNIKQGVLAYLFNIKDNNILSQYKGFMYENEVVIDMLEDLTIQDEEYSKTYGENNVLAVKYDIENHDVCLLMIAPIKNGDGKAFKILFYNFLIIILMLILSLIFASIVSFTILTPINALENEMRKVVYGSSNRLDLKSNYNEFSMLAKNFNSMINRLHKLASELKNKEMQNLEIEKRKNQAELIGLQSQMNPHFLYNIITSIVFTLKKNDIDSACEMLIATGKFLKSGLSRGDVLVNLQNEIEQVQNYFIIQKFRYKERVKLNLNIDEETLNYRVLRFIIQPLVENSIRHGMKKSESLKISISSRLNKNSNLEIVIEDNGKGFEKDQLAKIESLLISDNVKSMHIGLKNIQERIHLYFGMRFGLRIYSIIDEGTKIVIELPKNV